MKALDIHEAANLCRTRLQGVNGLKASVAVLMWKTVLWLLGELYPRYVIAEVDPGGVPVGQPSGEAGE